MEDMETFMNTIKELIDDDAISTESDISSDTDPSNELGVRDLNEESEHQAKNEKAGNSMQSIADEMINLDILGDELRSGKQLYECEECEASYKSKSGLSKHNHTRSKHGGICYSCKYCGYKASYRSNLNRHQKSIHEGAAFFCNQCDFMATDKGSLKRHQESTHEGIKYSCKNCKYKAADKGNLKRHHESIHEGVRYSCDKCKYQTGWKQDLKNHKARKHSQLI